MSQTATYEITPEQARTAQIVGAIISALGILAILFPVFTGLSLSVLLGALLVSTVVVSAAIG